MRGHFGQGQDRTHGPASLTDCGRAGIETDAQHGLPAYGDLRRGMAAGRMIRGVLSSALSDLRPALPVSRPLLPRWSATSAGGCASVTVSMSTSGVAPSWAASTLNAAMPSLRCRWANRSEARRRTGGRATAVLRSGQALILQHPQRVADGHPGHAVVLHQLRLRRQLLTLGQPGPADRIPQVIRDLLIHRPVGRRVDHLRQYAVTGHHRPQDLSTCLAQYASREVIF